MQNLLRIDYEKILLLSTVIFRGDYPIDNQNNLASAEDRFSQITFVQITSGYFLISISRLITSSDPDWDLVALFSSGIFYIGLLSRIIRSMGLYK